MGNLEQWSIVSGSIQAIVTTCIVYVKQEGINQNIRILTVPIRRDVLYVMPIYNMLVIKLSVAHLKSIILVEVKGKLGGRGLTKLG